MLKLRIKFKKHLLMKYISHLDLMRLFQRAFRRASIPIEYSEGYNPKPKFSFATALALGTTSEAEYMDLELKEKINSNEFIEKMNNVLPQGIEILEANYTDDKSSLMSLVKSSTYTIELELLENINENDVKDIIDNFIEKDEIYITKSKKKKGRTIKRDIDIRSNIYELSLVSFEGNKIVLKTLLQTGSSGNLKPELLIDSLINEGLMVNSSDYKIHRVELFT
ncbi:TIGR03936 family radical SAM-associated protein [Senegalia sp. (in: firmicutes)]|uniref:TIGR03936 family radical SAM-associated protein n=1 Tax=Senegalia sp. (in: firmicutes) TaxID=1924098 RepID=UPI003F977A58